MLLKALFLAILIYYVLRTATRLIAAMKTVRTPSHLGSDPSTRWDTRNAGAREEPQRRPVYDDEDIEDAKFVDV